MKIEFGPEMNTLLWLLQGYVILKVVAVLTALFNDIYMSLTIRGETRRIMNAFVGKKDSNE